MAISHITVLGGDLRQAYASEYLASCGYRITCYGTPDFPYDSSIQVAESLPQALKDTSILLMPTPFLLTASICFKKNRLLLPFP